MTNDPSNQHNQRLAMGYEPINNIKSNPRDARIYKEAEKRRIVRAVSQFGPLPLVVDANRVVLSGNVWLEAASLAGFSEVPIFVVAHLSPAEADAFMLFQVRAIEHGEWDEKILGQVLRDLTLENVDLDVSLTGFDPPEIDLIIAGLEEPGAPDPADEPVPAGPSVATPGDLWILGDHRLHCADALKADSYKKVLAGESAHVIVSDPPFNVAIAGNVSGLGAVTHREFVMASGEMSEAEFINFHITALSFMAAHSHKGSLHYLATDWRHIYELLSAGRQVYDGLLNICVWSKDKPGMGAFYRSQHEFFFVFKHGKARHRNNVQLGRFGRNRSNIWAYPSASTFSRGGEEGNLLHQHPTIKPVALIADVLLDASRRNDIALDPFAGSGTIFIAAEKTGRRARGIEIDSGYVDVAIRRWQHWTGRDACLDGDGRTYLEISRERAVEVVHDEQ